MNIIDKINEGVYYDKEYIKGLKLTDFYLNLSSIEKILYTGSGWIGRLKEYNFEFYTWLNADDVYELYLVLYGIGFNDKMIIYDCSGLITENYTSYDKEVQSDTLHFFRHIVAQLE